jgi:predicted alpha/beta-fold hydrolase
VVSEQPNSGAAFELAPFQVHPFLASGHLQTVAAVYLPYGTPKYQSQPHHVLLADGDKLVLHDDTPASWTRGGPVVLLVHGLGGCHRSPYVVRAANKLNQLGVRTFAMDLRGCGAGFQLARYPTHAGRSEDLAAAISSLRKLCPGSPLIVVGYSMSGNMALKLLGEWGENLPAQLDSVVAVSPPVNLEACSASFRLGINRLYDRYYLSKVLQVLGRKRREVCPHLYRPQARTPRSLREFDDLYTAPLCGFADSEHYYHEASSFRLVEHIRLPTLVITADDDPIVPVHSLRELPWPESVQFHETRGGGHLGFLGRRGVDPDRRWIDWRVVAWVQHRLLSPHHERSRGS